MNPILQAFRRQYEAFLVGVTYRPNVIIFDRILADPRSATSPWRCRVVATKVGGRHHILLEPDFLGPEGPQGQPAPLGVFSAAACKEIGCDPLRSVYWSLDPFEFSSTWIMTCVWFGAFEPDEFHLARELSRPLPPRVRRALFQAQYDLARVLVIPPGAAS